MVLLTIKENYWAEKETFAPMTLKSGVLLLRFQIALRLPAFTLLYSCSECLVKM